MEETPLPEAIQDRFDTLDAWYEDTVAPRRQAFNDYMQTLPPEVCARHIDNLSQYLTNEGDVALIKLYVMKEPEVPLQNLMDWLYGLRLSRTERNFTAYITEQELESYRSALWEFLVHEADTNELKERLSTL